jgi:hypothetical protein
MAQMCLVKEAMFPDGWAGTLRTPLRPIGGLMSSLLLTGFMGELSCRGMTRPGQPGQAGDGRDHVPPMLMSQCPLPQPHRHEVAGPVLLSTSCIPGQADGGCPAFRQAGLLPPPSRPTDLCRGARDAEDLTHPGPLGSIPTQESLLTLLPAAHLRATSCH